MPLDTALDDSLPPPPSTSRGVSETYGHLDGEALLDVLIHKVFPGRIAVSSSFGTESAVLLHLVSRVAPATPVLFLDTGMLFAQTDQYRRELQDRLGLSDIRIIRPDEDHLREYDPDGALHQRDPDACCHLRKVLPMQRVLDGFDAWITGRKRIHGGLRQSLPVIEHDGKHAKINPLAAWDNDRIQAEFTKHNLPRHPLEEMGYTSVGCHPCTGLPAADSGVRSGRWSGLDKTECGIHKAPWAGQDI
ncbi:MAG: phosphoadenylyl-sulfate reductase [Rhodospirillales bacterium]|nr:phosphoadenylyl-sulfate reductase [Rhodospirillales bacterium]